MNQRIGRMAPRWFARTPSHVDSSVLPLWRGLRMAWVPLSGDAMLAQILKGHRTESPFNSSIRFAQGEANGPAMRFIGTGQTCDSENAYIPNVGPFSVAAFIVKRTSGGNQQFFGNGNPGNGGWTFKIDFGTNTVGLIRWNIANHASSLTIPLGEPAVIGMTHDDTNSRFFVNGKFETLATGAAAAAGGLVCRIGLAGSGTEPVSDCSIHVIYFWTRLLSDAEFQRLYQDPWAIVRPSARMVGVSGGGGVVGSGARSFAAMIG